MASLKITVDPAIEPVSLEQAKRHSRVTTNTEDILFQEYIQSARERAEKVTRRQLINATWRLRLDEFPLSDDVPIKLPKPPLSSVTSITYIDGAGATQTWASSNYTVHTDDELGKVTPNFGVSYPTTQDVINAVTITYIAGYGATSNNVPANIRTAILQFVDNSYENRSAVLKGTISKEADQAGAFLLEPYMVSEFI